MNEPRTVRVKNGAAERFNGRRQGRALMHSLICCETLPSRRHTEGVTADRRDRTVCWASDAEIPIGRLGAGSPVLWPCAAV